MEHALKVIEFDAILQMLATECETPLGRQAALRVRPSVEPAQVADLMALTGEALETLDEGPPSLAGVHDLTEALKLAAKQAVLEGEVLARVGRYLEIADAVRAKLAKRNDRPLLRIRAQRMPDVPTLRTKVDRCIDAEGQVKDEASVKLGSLRARRATLQARALERIQSYVSGPNRGLLSDPIYTQREGRYVLPLKAENRGKIKGIVHDSSASGQTIYLEPQDVVDIGNELRAVEGQVREEERRVRADVSGAVGAVADPLLDGLDAVTDLDLALAKARLGSRQGGCLPKPLKGPRVKVVQGRHPLIDRAVVVPFSLDLGEGTDVLLITGPNTGGKTVTMKGLGLVVAMGQAGLMPCAEEVHLGCFSQLWADIGDEQSLQQSLSTFSAHIRTVAEALNGLKPGALVLLDEVGAGTDPAEGAALARALLLAFQRGGARVLSSTHYGELKLFATNAPGFMNASMEFDRKTMRPTYRLLVGVPGSSYAFHIAKRYGVADDVIEVAEAGVQPESRAIAETIAKLEQAEKQARAAQSEADRLASQLKKLEASLAEQEEQLESSRRDVRQRLAKELDEVLRQIRLEAAEIFEDLRKSPTQEGRDKARAKLRDLQNVGTSFVQEMKPKAPKLKPIAPPPQGLQRGMTVRVRGLGQTGTILEPPQGKRVAVQMGAMRTMVDVGHIEVIGGPKPEPKRAPTGAAAMMRHRAQTAQRELNLRRYRADEAADMLDKFIDEALLAGVERVRIVHGKGEGVLREIVRQRLKNHRGVKSFSLASAEAGGDGVTEVVFE